MNAFERRVHDAIVGAGWKVLRGGWPDFAVIDERGRIMCVIELKAGWDRLHAGQMAMHEALREADIPVVALHESHVEHYIEGLRRIRAYRDAKLSKQLRLDTVVPMISSPRPHVLEVLRSEEPLRLEASGYVWPLEPSP